MFAAHFEAHTPAMDTADFDACVSLQAEVLRDFAPDVLVASSFGGAVAVELLRSGAWRGPTLLLAQAALKRDSGARLPEGVVVWLVHGRDDALIDLMGEFAGVEILEIRLIFQVVEVRQAFKGFADSTLVCPQG